MKRYDAVERRKATLILAHGAGAGEKHPFMVRFATGFAERGITTITFNFPYMDSKKRRPPDKADVLEATWQKRIDAEEERVFIGGKSMGGRIATQVAAKDADVRGIVLFGYPLHPPNKPDDRRDAHLPSVRAPMLFVQGEHDEFGDASEMRPLVQKLGADLHIVENADHSLSAPPKKEQEAIYDRVLDHAVRWMEAH